MEDNRPQDIEIPQAAEQDMTDGKKKRKKEKVKKTLGREILEWVTTFAVAIVLALIIRTFVFEPVRVDGDSMKNTLINNEYMIVTKYDYLFGDPERFDVVVCHYPDRGRTNFVKRVVGVPGDIVTISDGRLFVNGEEIIEEYIEYKASYNMDSYTLRADEYFVLGDNRASSNDSHIIGPLQRDQIKGHVRYVVYPFNVARAIE